MDHPVSAPGSPNPQSPVATTNPHQTEREYLLNYANIRLMAWGNWAKQHSESLGYPKLSLVYKVMRRRAKRLGARRPMEECIRGLTARGTETRSLRPRSVGEVPDAISDVDRVVAALERTNKRIIHIEYLTPESPQEAKAAQAGMYTFDYRRALKRAKLAVAGHLN